MLKKTTKNTPFPPISNREDLRTIREKVYDPCGFSCTDPIAETESAEYGACRFQLHGKSVVYRSAKITPTKTGLFVTLWKRSEKGPIAPFDESDTIDLVIISTRAGDRFGQFIFPKAALLANRVFSKGEKEGKRAIRVYPPWDTDLNKQAQKTQKWQLDYFLEITENTTDPERAAQLIAG